MKIWKRLVCISMALLLLLSFAGCGSSNKDVNGNEDKVIESGSDGEKGSADSGDNKENASGPEPLTLPIANGDVELLIYVYFPNGARQVYESLADHPVVKYIEKETGLKLKFMHPPQGDDGTFFNTTIASGEYPDLFQADFKSYPGGPDGAVEDGVIINMNDLIYKYAPNFLKLVEEKGELVKKRIKSDSGMIIRFGTIMQPPFLEGKVNRGLLCRSDWLRDLSMEDPETIDEYTSVLKAFKNELNVEVPLALPKATDWIWQKDNVFASAFGVTHNNFYLDNGRVKYSRMQPGYKEYLELLRYYYSEGLLDQDFANRTNDDQKKSLINGRAGIALLGNWVTRQCLQLGKMEDPDYDLVGLKYPRKNKGDILHLADQAISVDNRAWFVSSSCKHPVEAVKFIDYLHITETNRMCAWGLGPDEGVAENPTYEYKDGKRVFTDFMQNNPDVDYPTARDRYTLNPFQVMWEEEMEKQQYNAPQNLQAWDAWGYNNDNANLVPNVITMTPDESREYADIMNQVTTYTDEMFYKFIMSEESLDKFDDYVKQIESFGIDKAIAIQQAAYDRYLAR